MEPKGKTAQEKPNKLPDLQAPVEADLQKPAAPKQDAPPKPQPPAKPSKTDPVRLWVLSFAGLCLLLLAWYLLANRLTPFTTQARVNAFVVAVTPRVSGNVLAVDVTNNQIVTKDQRLALIDPAPYEIAVASAEAQLALTLQDLKASSAQVDSAKAKLESARANLVKARQDFIRVQRIAKEDSGAISQRRLEISAASLKEAEAGVSSAQADLQKAIDQRGPPDENNPQLLAARSALDQARLNLSYTRVTAPADGLITDLQIDEGSYAQPGRPLMTFVAIHDLWVQADLTENNIGLVKPGDPVEITLDLWPGKVLRGKVRSFTYGVSAPESVSSPGALPKVQNTRDWVRDAQRFPTLIDFDDREAATNLGVRVGSQASVIVYTGEHPILNALGRFLIRLMSWFSYAY